MSDENETAFAMSGLMQRMHNFIGGLRAVRYCEVLGGFPNSGCMPVGIAEVEIQVR